jgi:DNA-binding transcriptional LysR family regulator
LARGSETAPQGRVRIAAPPALAVDHLAPLAAAVKRLFPGIRLEVLASIEHVDLSRGIADFAIRTRPPHEPELTSVGHLTVPLGVFASAAYAATVPRPARLENLDWITWAFPYEHVPPRPYLERAIPNFEPAFASDNYLVQRSALYAGLGAMIFEKPLRPRTAHPGNDGPKPTAESPELVAESTELIELDVGIQLPAGELHLVCARSMQFVPRVRAVMDLLRSELLEDPSPRRPDRKRSASRSRPSAR